MDPSSRTRREAENDLLAALVQRIREVAEPERIVLFGSRATGSAAADSDVDLMVVESEPFGPLRSRRKEIARLARSLAPVGVPVDLLVYSHDEVQRWSGERSHVIARALREGRVLYARQA